MEETQTNSISSSDQSKRLSAIFHDGWETLDVVEEHPDPNSIEYKKLLIRARECFELSTCLVNEIDLFSINELFEEISTESLKYILLPFYLGKVSMKRNSSIEERGDILQLAETYYKDFLQRCENYGLSDGISNSKINRVDEGDDNHNNENDENKRTTSTNQQLLNAAIARNEKIKKYQHKKELNKFIQKMKGLIRSSDGNNDENADDIDDEIRREFYLKLLQSSIMDAREEMELIKMEKEMVAMRHRTQMTSLEEGQSEIATSSTKVRSNRPKVRSFQPFIIARNEAQKNVFGLGYPSVPVMTVEDFYNQRVKEGIFPSQAKVAEMNKTQLAASHQDTEELEENEKAELEKQIEEDDPQYLERMRRMDEHRDMVRRGDGNRYNRS